MTLEIRPVVGIGEVRPGDDLATLIAEAAPWLRDGDLLVVTSKIVSKAEGRLVDLPDDESGRQAALAAALAAETSQVVARRRGVRIVRTHHGFVMAAAGIDNSNVERSRIVLLPKDPDASARSLRAALRARHGLRVAVVVSDTMGRAWRVGQTDVALGAAGLPAVRDHRGEVDPYGNELRVTEIAVVDELAAAAELVKGKFEQVPVAVVRGLPGLSGDEPDGPGAAVLVRDQAQDLFGLGAAEAHAGGLRAAAVLPDDPVATDDGSAAPEPGAVTAAIALVSGSIAPDTQIIDRAGTTHHEIEVRGTATTSAAGLIRLGADLHRLRAALAGHDIDSTVVRYTGSPVPAAVLRCTAAPSDDTA